MLTLVKFSELATLLVKPALDLSVREADFTPYPLNRITQHAPPGAIVKGPYPTVTDLEHDEAGHPTGNPALHMKMTAKRREK